MKVYMVFYDAENYFYAEAENENEAVATAEAALGRADHQYVDELTEAQAAMYRGARRSAYIYTDGRSMEVNLAQASALIARGLCEPHPGAGHDGIRDIDLRLTATGTWAGVEAAIALAP